MKKSFGSCRLWGVGLLLLLLTGCRQAKTGAAQALPTPEATATPMRHRNIVFLQRSILPFPRPHGYSRSYGHSLCGACIGAAGRGGDDAGGVLYL